ncbi:YtcA family uncharacterized protein [Trinickia symbiotica]|uniref:Uncharacterized protein YtcA n=1 Tax=Trinickia symbiotica TaxID=863227 RepID=A0A2N7WWK7_9BURK|nr:YtcA family lipoprotein [Trinickia symbiotica]PMS33873.1 hypothetical protein C0Z20_23380 [Trinickia symbiotica]PPK42465.1 YtcA family uncharacterized protein [Trinickia symbiotica]
MSSLSVSSLASLSTAGLLLSGCSFAPSIPLFGAAFPDWLFCVVGGVTATVAVHLALTRRGANTALAPHALSYPALSALFALTAWLAFFSR